MKASFNMSQITDTTNQTVFHRTSSTSPNETAIFILLTNTDYTNNNKNKYITQITLPEKSTWTPSPHWHETHTEFFRVLQGRVLLKLNSIPQILTPSSGTIRVDKFVIHEFMRADINAPDIDKDPGDVITQEWTEPDDGAKHVFFRNLFSVLQDSRDFWGDRTKWQIRILEASYDNFEVVVPGRWTGYFVAHGMQIGARLAAWWFGLRPWVEEYTPVGLREVAIASAARGFG